MTASAPASVAGAGAAAAARVALRTALRSAHPPRGDPLGHGARPQLRLGRQCQLRMDHDVARLDVVVRIFKDADLPAALRQSYLGSAPARDLQAFGQRSAIERLHFRVERAPRLVENARQNAPQALHVVRVQVHVIDRRRQRRVRERLEALPHIADDLVDDFPGGGRVAGGRTVHKEPCSILAVPGAATRGRFLPRVLHAAKPDVGSFPARRHRAGIPDHRIEQRAVESPAPYRIPGLFRAGRWR